MGVSKLRNRNKLKRWAGKPVQKLEDEYTGGPIYSDNIEYDYKGVLTNRHSADPYPTPELPLYIPEEARPDFIRNLPNMSFVDLVEALDIYWDTDADNWSDSNFEY